jgi:type III secretion protein C
MLLSLCLLLAYSPVSYAYNLMWDNKYTHFAKEEPLKDMLLALAAEQNTPIIVSDQIQDSVSVYYRDKSTSEIINDLKKTYNLMTFFDGSTLYVYKKDEIKHASVTLEKNPITSLEYELIEKKVLDKKSKNIRWELDRGTNSVSFDGPARFVEIVLEIANRLDQSNLNINIYKWKAPDGTINYSNEPPFDSKYERVKTIRRYKTIPVTTTVSKSKKK